MRFFANHNDTINSVVLKNARENSRMVAHDIQKDLVHATAIKTTNAIINDLWDESFGILLDDGHDESSKEQVVVALHYIDSKECIIECFLVIM